MSRLRAALLITWLCFALVAAAATAAAQPAPTGAAQGSDSSGAAASDFEAGLRSSIHSHLGRPYVWGACGLKSFDCSGFVWRVMQDNGILVKRTTARKYYLSLPRVAGERWRFGNIVFFSSLKHCGIVDSPGTFYHAAVTAGTHLSRFDPLWRARISGVRAMPGLVRQGASRP